MSAELRLKKLRGSGGFVMARVTDEQQSKGNLGGPDLFLAPIGSCLLYTSPSPRDVEESRMPSSA